LKKLCGNRAVLCPTPEPRAGRCPDSLPAPLAAGSIGRCRGRRGTGQGRCLTPRDHSLLRGGVNAHEATTAGRAGAAVLLVAGGGGGAGRRFPPPVRLKAGGVPIRVESPGYAAPCLADLDGKGKVDLLVGQFNGGKIQVFKGLGKGAFAKGSWLQAEGKVAEV